MATFAGNANKSVHENSSETIAIILKVKSVDDEYAKINTIGVTFVNEPVVMAAWDMLVVHLRETGGNLIELFSELLNKS